jgi:hypothetical protein
LRSRAPQFPAAATYPALRVVNLGLIVAALAVTAAGGLQIVQPHES